MNRRPHTQHGVAIVAGQFGFGGEVTYMQGRRTPQVNVAIDAAESPVVLVFQVAARRPAVDTHSQQIFPRLQIGCEIELRRGAAVLAIADRLPIHPEMKGRINAIKSQENLATNPLLRHGKSRAIRAGWVVISRDSRQVANVKGIGDIGVDRRVIFINTLLGETGLNLPVTGNGGAFPAGRSKGWLVKIERCGARVWRPVKMPLPIEQFAIGRGEPLAGQRFLASGVGYEGRVGRFFVAPQQLGIVPVVDWL